MVTGAGGFVGRSLAQVLEGRVHSVSMAASRWRESLEAMPWRGATVYHLGARVHGPDASEAEFQRDNVEKSRALALAAAAGGARRLVFLSSAKVNGEETATRAFCAADPPAPDDAYARSKRDAEAALLEVGKSGALEVAILRSPLVIGPGAKGNLRAMARLADSSWPLPFAAVANRRTFIDVADLANLLVTCGEHPAAPGHVWLAGHPDAVATPRLFTVARRALGRPARLFGMPPALLEGVAAIAGLGPKMRRLTRSLELDVGDTMAGLGWSPRRDMDASIAAMAAAWRA